MRKTIGWLAAFALTLTACEDASQGPIGPELIGYTVSLIQLDLARIQTCSGETDVDIYYWFRINGRTVAQVPDGASSVSRDGSRLPLSGAVDVGPNDEFVIEGEVWDDDTAVLGSPDDPIARFSLRQRAGVNAGQLVGVSTVGGCLVRLPYSVVEIFA